ncbi:MAG TPA: ParB/RepB/Spo0J family partition protein [Candidatus Dojkabacteria bacterium]|nr:ParB/RepB/Spo0J family partition protein [Candidatus Dojkabacteria bacterium]HRO65676.1 ParB/RepB/Spo0J family partition protein [Candidatus Dojkabacteria bacterium]HRP50992.1 ParB/RepB/Spo0J family partition protein [Candidatus Dojkabacteria bacterium]
MGLGKGLSSLISESTLEELNQAYIPHLDINLVEPNPFQPRLTRQDPKLAQLADSIRENGIIEPLLVTKTPEGQFQLIAGERRLKAAKLAGKKDVPVIVKEASPQQMLELAVIENIHRKDLNPLEEAMAFMQLRERFKMTDELISSKVGFSRSAVTNKMRLLSLPMELKEFLLDDKISEGHARALLGLKSRATMHVAADKVIEQNLSVRATEELVRRLNKGTPKNKEGRYRIEDEFTFKVETDLRSRYGEKVKLFRSSRGGKIVIPFENDDQLKNIYSSIV